MSKSKSTTLESPPKFLQDKENVKQERQETLPPEFSVVPITDQRVLEQYRLVEEAENATKARMNVLAGMVTMIQPEGAQFNYEERCFMVPIPERNNNEESNERADD